MATPQTKVCRKCGQEKPAADFPKNRRVCRACTKARQRRWEADNREHVNRKSREWAEANPGKSRAIKERWYAREGVRVREKASARYWSIPETFRQYGRDYYSSNAAEVKARANRYRATNPDKCGAACRKAKAKKPAKYRAIQYHNVLRRRARRAGLPDNWTRRHAADALRHFGQSCAVCETPFGLVAKAHFDHWIPLTHPTCPGTVPANMVPLCSSCNLSKNNRDAGTWLRSKYPKRAERIASRVAAYFNRLTDKESSPPR